MKFKFLATLIFSFLAILSTHLIKAATNVVVPNSSMQTVNPSDSSKPMNWIPDEWGTNTKTFSYLTTGRTDERSIKVEITNYTSGDAKWYFEPQPVSAGTTYTVSDYYKSNVVSRVVIMFTLSNGTEQYIELPQAPASSNWAQYNATVKAPTNAATMSVFHLISRVGWLTTDDYSVTTGTAPTPTNTPIVTPTATPTPTMSPTPTSTVTPSPTPTATPTATPIPTVTPAPGVNVIQNHSLESEKTTTMPNHWATQRWGNNTATFTYHRSQGKTGSHSVKVHLASYVDGDAKWYFNPVHVTPGDTYNFSNWYKSNITSHVIVAFTFSNGAPDYYLELRTASASNIWKKYSESFQVPANAATMTVLHVIKNNGWLQTDDYNLSRITPRPYSRPMVTIDFDDGWEHDTVNALPILDQYNYKATFFFATSYLDGTPETGPINISGPTAVRTLFQQGHEIGGHSVTHPNLTSLDASTLSYEVTHSKNYLESLIGAGNVLNFATPYGAYNTTVLNALMPLYRSHRPTDEGFNTKDNFSIYKLKVQNMQISTTLAQFQSWIDQAKRDKSWLILVYHKVSENATDQFDTKLSDFVAQMAALNASGVTVLTTNQALNEIAAQ